MIGSMEPDFRFLTCRAVLCRGLSKAWQKKIPQRSEDDFLLTNQAPKGGRLAQSTRQMAIFAGKKLKGRQDIVNYRLQKKPSLGGRLND